MTPVPRSTALDALEAVYQNVTAVTGRLGEPGLMRPTRCAGWAVTDVLYHQLLDARRALRTLASRGTCWRPRTSWPRSRSRPPFTTST